MNREEFEKMYFGKAVHCDTEEKANEFLALADSVGYKWSSGKSLIEKNGWETYEEETCYDLTNDGLMYSNTNFFNRYNDQIIEYQLQQQSKFKVGDKVRIIVNSTIYSIYGKIGVVEREGYSRSLMEYVVKVDGRIWYLYENELEKVEEPTYKEETIDDIIEEIKDNQKRTTVLLNRLAIKVKNK